MNLKTNILAIALGAAVPAITLATAMVAAPAAAQSNVTYYFYCVTSDGDRTVYIGPIFSHRSNGYADTQVSDTTSERIAFGDLLRSRGYRNDPSRMSCQGPLESSSEAAAARQNDISNYRRGGWAVVEP